MPRLDRVGGIVTWIAKQTPRIILVAAVNKKIIVERFDASEDKQSNGVEHGANYQNDDKDNLNFLFVEHGSLSVGGAALAIARKLGKRISF